MSELAFETRQIHAGQQPDSDTGSRALPIYQTTSFVFPSAQTAADRFSLKELGPIYSRLGNPTLEVVETRIASLEGGVGAVLLSSGQAALTLAILNIAGPGDHVVASAALYGGSYNLLDVTLRRLGIDTTFVQDASDIEQWRAAARPTTKAFFGEAVANPESLVLDLRAVADAAHDAGVPFIVDSTSTTPYLVRPIEHGADIVIHSATKYLGGHGSAIGGVVVDAGTFDFSQDPERFPDFNQPDASYNGLVYARDLGPDSPFGANVSYGIKLRVQLLRDIGACLSPFNAFLIAQGIETLSLRVERHVQNAQAVAEWLEAHEAVESVSYAGLASSPSAELARRYLPKGVGSVLGFTLRDGYDAAVAFVDALELHSQVANIGDVRSLVIHPASTTHSQLDEEAQRGAGVGPGFIRLSVGLEAVQDILADLEKGFAAAASVSEAGAEHRELATAGADRA